MRYLKLSLILCASAAILAACGSRGGSGGSPTAPVTPSSEKTYYFSDGACYRASDNDIVNDSKCDDLEFYLDEGECFRLSDDESVAIGNCTDSNYFLGQRSCYDRRADVVDANLCFENSNEPIGEVPNGISGLPQKVCEGWYEEPRSDGFHTAYCEGSNCSGRAMWEISSNLFFYCL